MNETFDALFRLLNHVVLPNLKTIASSQSEQAIQTDLLNNQLEEFRVEMHMRLSSIHAEIAACRQQMEDTMEKFWEQESRRHTPETARKNGRNIH